MTEPYTIIRRFLFELVGTISLDRNYWEVINLLFVLPGLYLNILETEKILQFWDNSRRWWHVIKLGAWPKNDWEPLSYRLIAIVRFEIKSIRHILAHTEYRVKRITKCKEPAAILSSILNFKVKSFTTRREDKMFSKEPYGRSLMVLLRNGKNVS